MSKTMRFRGGSEKKKTIASVTAKSTKKTTKKTKKSVSSSSSSKSVSLKKYSKEDIVVSFLRILNTVKLYHWRTMSYAEHKATDELYSKLNEHIDSFVEVLLGKKGDRVDLSSMKNISLKDYPDTMNFKKAVEEWKEYMIEMTSDLDKDKDTDLLNIRDEILGDLNQFTYLLTLGK